VRHKSIMLAAIMQCARDDLRRNHLSRFLIRINKPSCHIMIDESGSLKDYARLLCNDGVNKYNGGIYVRRSFLGEGR